MPTVHREHGLRFVIYTDDHLPAHVHGFGHGEMKVAILGSAGLPEMVYAIRMKARERRLGMDVVLQRQEEFMRDWTRIHGAAE